MANISKIINIMHKNRKINKGQPIVAVAFERNYKPIAIASNKKRTKSDTINWDTEHEKHAEWLVMSYLEENNINSEKLHLFITTSPCDDCAERLLTNFKFKKIYYLFEKFNEREIKYKEIENIEKFNLENSKFSRKTYENIEEMERHWNISNLTNKKKTRKNNEKN